MINLNDKIKIQRKSNKEKYDTRYRCSCNKCGFDRGYLSKERADQLCRSCNGKAIRLGGNRVGQRFSKQARAKMSLAKQNSTPWNKGKSELRYEVKIKMALAKINYIPWNKGKGNLQADENVKNMLRHRLRRFIKGAPSQQGFSELVGCSYLELRKLIESKFTEGMTWKNWSVNGWHIDHIKPLSKFDLTGLEQLKEACSYKNLQPLWAKDNLKKSDN